MHFLFLFFEKEIDQKSISVTVLSLFRIPKIWTRFEIIRSVKNVDQKF